MRIRMVNDGQFGDTGKGKTVDFLNNPEGPWAGKVAVNARWNGSHNAGHTVWFRGVKYAMHVVPSSIVSGHATSLIAPNCFVNPSKLLDEELPELQQLGVDVSDLKIAREAWVIMPWHILREQEEKKAIGGKGHDTTMQGNGPAHADRIGRHGIRIGDLLDPEALAARLQMILPVQNLIPAIAAKGWTIPQLVDQFSAYGERLRPMVVGLDEFLHLQLNRPLRNHKALNLEMGQGPQLDIDAANYPYNTSSGCTACDAAKIFGFMPQEVEQSVMVTKLYATSVGHRVFPTKMPPQQAQRIQERGEERGTTSGRLRDCGWLDLVLLQDSVKKTWATSLFVTKMDVLDEEDEIKICVAYKRDCEIRETPPRYSLAGCEPVYKTFPGWRTSTRGITKLADLPYNARVPLDFVAEQLEKPIIAISTGPERNETIWLG